MYTIQTSDGYIVYNPGSDGSAVYNAVLTETLNDAGQLVFTMPKTNNSYNVIEEGITRIILYNGNNIIWRGFVESTSVNFRQDKTVTCIGELSYLSRSVQYQSCFNSKKAGWLLNWYINHHNAMCDEQFTKGNVILDNDIARSSIYTNYETTLDAIRGNICDRFGVYIKLRYEGETRYIDLYDISNYGQLSTQTIQFGENLLDYSKNISTLDVYTQVLPLGATLDTQYIPNLDNRLNIESVNGGVQYLENSALKAKFGARLKVVEWDDVTVASNLKTKAQEWLDNQQFAQMQLQLTAIDLSMLKTNVDSFNVGDSVRVVAPVYNLDITLPVMSKTTNLQAPDKNQITIGNNVELSYTKMNSTTSGTSMSINNAWSGTVSVGALKINGNNLSNFVVEQGTTNGWTYRKWSNGFCEMWKAVATGTLSWSATGNVYYSNEILYNVPSFLATVAGVQFTPRNVSVLGCSQTSTTVTNNQLGFRVHRSTQGTASINIDVALQGTWQQ